MHHVIPTSRASNLATHGESGFQLGVRAPTHRRRRKSEKVRSYFVSGEELHELGRMGAIRAKRWLDATTRVDVTWVNPDAVAKLTFAWKDGSKFSFDLGGTLRGGDVHGQEFFAEIKKYNTAGDQSVLYSEYLAKCFRAFCDMPSRCDHFMWLTWHPFSQTKWNQLCTAAEVRAAVLTHRAKCLGEGDEALASAAIDPAICDAVAGRLWLIVLSDRQESLVIDREDLELVIARQRRRTA